MPHGFDQPVALVAVLPDLRSAVHLRDPFKRGRRGREWVTQLLRQGDAKVFKKYSQIEAADETGGAEEAEPESQRRRSGF